MGELIVNIPVTIIILISVFIIGQFGLGSNLSIILGVGIGWYCWDKLIDKWVAWALSRNVDRERIFRLGKIGLINFYRHKIFDETSEDVT